MNKDSLIQLTNELYQLTLLFPKKEPLRYKIRELADDVLANSLRITNNYEYTNTRNKKAGDGPLQVLEDLKILNSYFKVAKAQNWVSPSNILELQQKYSKLKEELEKQSDLLVIPENEKTTYSPASIRQRKILEFLREKKRAQVREVKKIFPEVTKRTLRRDFRQMLKQGLIERIGERNETFYQIKG